MKRVGRHVEPSVSTSDFSAHGQPPLTETTQTSLKVVVPNVAGFSMYADEGGLRIWRLGS